MKVVVLLLPLPLYLCSTKAKASISLLSRNNKLGNYINCPQTSGKVAEWKLEIYCGLKIRKLGTGSPDPPP